MLDRLVEDFPDAGHFFNDMIVDKQLLAMNDQGVADNHVVEFLEHPRRSLAKLGLGRNRDQAHHQPGQVSRSLKHVAVSTRSR